MTQLCSAADISDIAALMATVDCQTAAYVESAYRGLFGDSGALTAALAGGLTIYVAIYGYRLIAGAGGATIPDLFRRFIAIGFILAFATNWPAYQTVFVSTITGGAEEVAQLMSVATTGRAETSQSVAEKLDEAIEEITVLADNWSRKTPLDAATINPAAPPDQGAATPPLFQPPPQSAPGSAVTMLWISAMLLGVASAGVIVITKIMLSFLLALGPAFLMLSLFSGARGLFEGWLRTIVAAAFVLVFTLLSTAGALSAIAPMVAGIADEQAIGVNNARSVFALLIACVVFALLIHQIISATARLTAGWRLPERTHAGASRELHDAEASQRPAALHDTRITDIVASVSRNGEEASRPRSAITPAYSAASEDFGQAHAGDVRRAARAYRGFGSARLRAAGGTL